MSKVLLTALDKSLCSVLYHLYPVIMVLVLIFCMSIEQSSEKISELINSRVVLRVMGAFFILAWCALRKMAKVDGWVIYYPYVIVFTPAAFIISWALIYSIIFWGLVLPDFELIAQALYLALWMQMFSCVFVFLTGRV